MILFKKAQIMNKENEIDKIINIFFLDFDTLISSVITVDQRYILNWF